MGFCSCDLKLVVENLRIRYLFEVLSFEFCLWRKGRGIYCVDVGSVNEVVIELLMVWCFLFFLDFGLNFEVELFIFFIFDFLFIDFKVVF